MYDLAIIGAGAAGIACAKQAVKSGLKTIIIEKNRDSLGGICLNRGCIPTKLALNYSKKGKSWEDVLSRRKEVVESVKNPLLSYLRQKGVEIIWGNVCLVDKNSIQIGADTIEAKNTIIASGSSSKKLFNHPKVVLAEELFHFPSLPEKFLIVGGGYIGIEFASMLHNFGKYVCVVEKEEQILLSFDYHFANRLRVILETKGIKINTGKTISDYNLDDFDMIIMATGREPNIEGLNLKGVGIDLEAEGWITTDKFMRTSVKNIYACGDITGKRMLAYVAEYQAEVCLNNITGNSQEEDYSGIPESVFSMPQAAKVGMLEGQAKQQGIKHRVIKSNFLRFSSAAVYDDNDGFLQVVAGEDDAIIGAGIISNHAAELISLFSLCIKNKLSLADLKKCVFVHPTLSEIIPLLLKAY